MASFTTDSTHTIIEFVTITRGGAEGLLAVMNVNDEHKYYELEGLHSLLKIFTTDEQKYALKAAITAIEKTVNLDEVPEFEGGLPVQGSLF